MLMRGKYLLYAYQKGKLQPYFIRFVSGGFRKKYLQVFTSKDHVNILKLNEMKLFRTSSVLWCPNVKKVQLPIVLFVAGKTSKRFAFMNQCDGSLRVWNTGVVRIYRVALKK